MKVRSNSWDESHCSKLEERYLGYDERSLKFYFKSKFLTRVFNWEFWPQKVLYIPVYLTDYILGFGSFNPVYFADANPSIPYGGMYACPKSGILDLLPKEVQPAYIHLPFGKSVDQKMQVFSKHDWTYPLILKPDLGDRGILVRKCATEKKVREYLSIAKFDVLVQEFILLPLEFGVFVYRESEDSPFIVSSITFKKNMHVIGNGKDSVSTLIANHPRLRLFKQAISQRLPKLILESIPKENEKIKVVSFGNHSKGSMFINANELIDSPLSDHIGQLCNSIDGFNYGRFDLMTKSVFDLCKGKFQIIELNGAMAEPTHIYEPAYPYLKGIGELIKHHYILFKIGRSKRKFKRNHPGLFKSISDLRRFRKFESELKKLD